MKGLLSGLSAVLIFMSYGCASSQQNEDPEDLYQNLVAINPPDNQSSAEESQIYVDSIKVITSDGRGALVIHGNFPDGCTSLKTADHSAHHDTLSVNLSAWRNPDLMCSQVLTQFSFIYDMLDVRELAGFATVTVNGISFNIR